MWVLDIVLLHLIQKSLWPSHLLNCEKYTVNDVKRSDLEVLCQDQVSGNCTTCYLLLYIN